MVDELVGVINSVTGIDWYSENYTLHCITKSKNEADNIINILKSHGVSNVKKVINEDGGYKVIVWIKYYNDKGKI